MDFGCELCLSHDAVVMIKPRRLSLAGHAGHVEKQMDATVN
jgi:hypothetical protein